MRRSIQNLLGACVVTACSGESARTVPAASDSVVATPAVRPSGTSYIGLSYDTPPAGVTPVGGAILPISSDTPGNYAFTRVTTARGEMIWLDTIGTRMRTVRAELRLPPLARDERLFISSCDVAAHLDPRIIAIVVNEPNVSRFTKVLQAWRVNTRAARFDVIPVAGISCEDPGSGP